MGQSPFAIVRGRRFENALFENDAERLRAALIAAGALPEGSAGFRDLRLRLHGGECPNLDAALDQTVELLTLMAGAARPKERTSLPTIVAGATIRIPGGVMLPEAILVIDVLTLRWDGGRPVLVAGEVKTYPDRGGYTEAAELATARAQLGVYLHGIEIVLDDAGLAGRIDIAFHGFLVFTRPGFNRPSVRCGEDLTYQIERARRGFKRLRDVAAATSTAAAGDGVEAVRDAACSYSEACLSFCDRASLCYGRALDSGDPVVLGEEVARFLGRADLTRACALLSGSVPRGETEKDLARRLRELRGLVLVS
jgi:hypothetical protein